MEGWFRIARRLKPAALLEPTRAVRVVGLLPQGLLETMSLKEFLNLLMGRFRNEPLL